MANTESLVFDLLVRDRASAGLGDIGKAADGASRNTDALTNRLNELSRKSVEARVRLAGDKEALASLDKMDARLISLDRRVASPNLKVDGAARAIAEISAVDVEMGRLGGKGGTAEAATASLGAGGLSGASGMGAAIAAGVALSPVIATVGLGLGGLGLAALGASKDTAAMHDVLAPLKSELAGFQASLKPEALTIFGDGVKVASTLLHDAQPVAKATGDALHGVLANLDAQFNSSQWTDFFGFMARTAGPDVKLLGQNISDLVAVLPQLLTNLQPIATELLQTTDAAVKLIGAADRLGTAASSLGSSSQHGAGFLDVMTGAVKRAVATVLPGVAAADLFRKGISAISSTSPGAASGITAVGDAAKAAAPVVGTLSGDVAILGTVTSNSTVALQAFSDLWNLFVGNAVGNQQAVLNVTQAFEGFAKAVQSSGRTSTQAQQAFLSIFTAIGAGLDTLHKNGASVSQLNDFYATSIARLRALHGLTPAQRADVAGLTKDYLAWASSVTGLSGNVVKAAGVIRQDFLTAMSLTHRLVPAVKADADGLAASILKTGTNSAATKHDRDVLIADLVRSGVSAAQARADVLGFQGQIDKLHGKTVPVDVTASGSGGIVVTAGQLASKIFKLSHLAAGGIVPGGYSRTDNHLAWLRSGEGVLQPGAVAALGGPGFIHSANARFGDVPVTRFAAGGVAGGVAGMVPFTAGQAAADIGGWAGADLQQMLNAMIAQAQAQAGFLGAGSGNYAADIATVLKAMGLPLSLVGNWMSQIQTESGGNLRAVNLTDSNAAAGHPSVGLLQLIPGTFHAYAGPYVNTPPLVNFGGGTVSEDPMAQIYAAIHYAAARYGGAAMAGVIGHGHGYDSGGYLPTGWSLAYNGTGKPEPVGPAAGNTYVINVHPAPLARPADIGREIVGAIRAFERGSGKGWRS